MSDSVYAVIAYVAGYWFLFLALLIIWRAIIWLRKDADRVSRVQRNLPDAGYIGEWAVVASEAVGLPAGTVLRAPRDGWIGSARACDIRLRDAGVQARAARFYLRPDGLHVLPQRSETLLVDGEPVMREAILRHGATLTVGGVTLQLRLFAGVVLTGESPPPSRRKRRRAKPVDEESADAASIRAEADEIFAPNEADGARVRLELPQPVMTIKRRGRRQRGT